MSRITVLCLALVLVGCTRSIRVPSPSEVQPEIIDLQRGLNDRMTAAEYFLSDVAVSAPDPSFSIGVFGGGLGANNVKLSRRFDFSMGRRDSQLSATTCIGQQRGNIVRVLGYVDDKTTRALACAGKGFQLQLEERGKNELFGRAQFISTSLEIETTNAMKQGLPSRVNGFTLRLNGTWLASFEYFWGGKAYFSPSLSPHERDAVMTAMLAILSTKEWLGAQADDNQARALF